MLGKTAILLPIFHGDIPEYLDLAIKSILDQSYQEFLLIICIDGEIGNEIRDIIDSVNEYENTFIISNPENRGLASILNEGIVYALKNSFSFIARMDSDDIMFNHRLEIQIEYLKSNPEVLALGSEAIIIDSMGKETGIKHARANVTYKNLLWRPSIIHPTVIFRAEFFSEVGMYDPGLYKSQDYDLWFRALAKGIHVQNIQEPLLYFRKTNELIRRRKREQLINIRIKRKYLNGLCFFLSIIPNIIIIILPYWFIKIFLNAVKK